MYLFPGFCFLKHGLKVRVKNLYRKKKIKVYRKKNPAYWKVRFPFMLFNFIFYVKTRKGTH
ncbi:hypothetical protein MmTuc01_2248 [Methanosarcina mazei Tuc01]|uniref:Uncharacterized protein n=1 Tax=Methanosarcina mazei Tuc01 TaxID=1236903 RepID=M1Q5H1_METMZ|nr:hypothetical protein MmTuc01_2248 [Methanosarcina mazei Tuc01]